MKETKRSIFLKVTCPRCKIPAILYGKSSIQIKCVKCNYKLTKSSGGKAKVRAPIQEVLWAQ